MKKSNENQMGKRAGFTIVELLTVMAVIAILIGLLVPALGLVHDTAKDLQQRAQFHGIEVGLEAYKSVYGSYPESDENAYAPATEIDPSDNYNGANKLAEAMLGWDLLGFHPKSEFISDGTEALGATDIYDGTDPVNLDERSDRFVELEKANAYLIGDIYPPASIGSSKVSVNSFVLCDSYSKLRSVSGLKTGTPILYFKARTKYRFQDMSDGTANDIYNYDDNKELLDLGLAEDGGIDHFIADGTDDYLDFEDLIINDQILTATTAQVPYLAEKYILMSAGKDGIFGNADDIYNFEKQK